MQPTFSVVAWFIGLYGLVLSTHTGLQNTHENKQEVLQSSLSKSTSQADANKRPLPWGQLNFLHTTDTHGWLPGHLLEPEFSADWGDYVAFVSHMRKLADSEGLDLLVVDTGDRHDGNGLSDATPVGGQVSQEIFKHMDFDIITIGNHELYQGVITQQEYELMRPYYGDRYIVTNVDIELSNGSVVPLGNRFRRFQTKNQQLQVLAFGVLFDFTGNDANSRVIKMADLIQQPWLTDLLQYTTEKDHVDVIVVTGHIPVRYFNELDRFVDFIRQYLPQVPIQVLGGHVHIRDFRIIDDYAAGLGSGRYLETVGWASIDGFGGDGVIFDRKYIDFNRDSLTFHSNTTLDPSQDDDNKPLFYTKQGISIKQEIRKARIDLNLSEVLACVPQNYLTDRARYPGPNSIFTLLEEHVMQLLKSDDSSLHDRPRFVFVNSGGIRFDMFAGPFTRDSGYIVSPFKNEWMFVKDVPREKAERILPMLNRMEKLSVDEEDQYESDYSVLGMPWQMRRRDLLEDLASINDLVSHEVQADEFSDNQESSDDVESSLLTKGYVTYDDLGNEGDDTPHRKWNSYYVPNAIKAQDHVDESTSTVDVVFYDFLVPVFTDIFKRLDMPDVEVHKYGGKRMIDLLPEYFNSIEGLEC